ERFAEKYRPVPPTIAGESGRYASVPYRIMAVPMTEAFEVLLADGVCRLRGSAGDWLVDYGGGSLGVVSPPIFATPYDFIGWAGMALHQAIPRVLLIGRHPEPILPAPASCPP